MRALARAAAAVLISLCLLPGALYAWPSSSSMGKDACDWKIGDVLIWRFPTQSEKVSQAASSRFDAAYKKGFRIEDVSVKKHDGKWTLFVGKTQILACDKAYVRGGGIDAKTMGVMMLSRIYDAIGKIHPSQRNEKHKLKGGHSITSNVSWYGGKFIGRKCANGEILTETLLCAAAKNLPFGTLVRVTVPSTKKSVVVRITDRFNEHKGRAIDVSVAAAELLGIKRAGVMKSQIDVIGGVGKIGGK